MSGPRTPAADVAAVFPPRTPADIDAYDPFAMVDGYLNYEQSDPEPGPNNSPGYRWGWTNRRRDNQLEDDGHDAVRHAHIVEGRLRAAGIPVREIAPTTPVPAQGVGR